MSKPGIVAPAQVAIDRHMDTPEPAAPARGGFWLAFAAIAWLAVTLWSTRAGLADDADESVALNEAALRLPSVVQASLLAGAAVGYAIAGRLSTTSRRAVGGLIVGLLIGVLASGAVLLAHGMPARAAGVAAVCVGLGGAVGGALGSLRPTELIGAALPAAIAVTGVDFVLNLLRSSIIGIFGDATTQAEIVSRDGLFLGSKALLVGLVAGTIAYALLRRTSVKWPVYVAAGGGAGIIIGLSELLTRTVGAQIFSLASDVSDADRTVQAWVGGARLNHALVVLFVGALLAMILHGRTLGKGRA
ncbi:F0F1-type ATP synthase assembly protein I [Allocatelliglobosispora scoriae]|uniref:F0F1-type ATP synthase assembly protein I n=1 Tax=Allocatelliglobosispora scoriae TaxID=643052 RepID=A0A841BR97_9ACTN|nr:hypothetical protein [Allocatelliglobosispora scoriae]MBB5870225.1 F0F1-type ATP synthase assembly protein I [Allocatelliglobosispora scoriae]